MNDPAGISMEEARAAKTKLRRMLTGLASVRGIGLTRNSSGYAVKLNLSAEAAEGTVPEHVDGVPIVVDVVGSIRAL